MRIWIIAPLCLAAAACGGDAADEKKAEGAPAQLPAGTWQVASEVTAFRSTDGTTPVVQAKVGDKANATVCVDKAGAQPPPALFVGEGDECSYKSAYIKEGVLNAALDCRREGLPGSIMVSVQGSYTAKGFEGTADATSYLSVRGGYQLSRKLSATVKPGACTPAPAGGGDDAEDGNKSGG